ncbi:MAG TPA: ribonuclease R [Candidatus Merdenecus merdavium]|nr:ribonuclease R [Candidatus Merdenecus merdavium]
MDQKFSERKEKIYAFICDEHYVPMKIKQIAIVLQVPKEMRKELKQILDDLVSEGKVDLSGKGRYSKSEGNFVVGTFIAHPRGFGFVEIEGEEEDIFIGESDIHGAMHKDRVQVSLKVGQRGKRQEGTIVKILNHGINEIVGTFEKSKNFGFVVADNLRFTKDIFIPIERSKGAVSGHKVLVEITSFGNKDKNPEGKVKEILGHMNDPGTDILSIVYAHELPMEFPERVLNQTERVSNEVSEADMLGRLDLRDTEMVTIDGEDAKDLDDAVSVSKKGDIYQLGVHIADVTNYVQEKSALDREALKRGTSVYLVDRVIPMLPHKLSNGICSLNAGADRLALSCIMNIDENGTVVGHKIAETVIRVNQRMSYTSVKKILEEDQEEINQYKPYVPMFHMMEDLAKILREKRKKRGSIDFDFPETKIILNDQGQPIDVKPYERNVATKIIEEFMLIANETVAQDYFWQEIPFVYRTHENPDPDKILKLGMFIHNFGYAIKNTKDEIHPKEIQKLLTKIEDTKEETLISRLALRSMKQAKYTVECTGHFGLAARYYCHFTSPIRRYPDLQIHRIIKENLRGRMNPQRIEHYEKILPGVANSSSKLERRAEEAEREVLKLKKVEYMEQYIGQAFEGIISGVTSFGLYVELPNTIEGMVHVTSLDDDYYIYNEDRYELVGEHLGNVYKLGEKVKIVVTGADRLQRTIDFEIERDKEHSIHD